MKDSSRNYKELLKSVKQEGKKITGKRLRDFNRYFTKKVYQGQ